MVASFGKMPNDIGSTFDLGVEALQWVRAVDLHPMRLREGHEREYIRFRFVHQVGELRELRSQLIGHCSPLRNCSLLAILSKHGTRDGGV